MASVNSRCASVAQGQPCVLQDQSALTSTFAVEFGTRTLTSSMPSGYTRCLWSARGALGVCLRPHVSTGRCLGCHHLSLTRERADPGFSAWEDIQAYRRTAQLSGDDSS